MPSPNDLRTGSPHGTSARAQNRKTGPIVATIPPWSYAACLSSTFGYRDDLLERVLSGPKSTAKFYLDSGWPQDNYEVTLAMAMAFGRRGYRVREDFLHLVFPEARHDETAWGSRACTCPCSSRSGSRFWRSGGASCELSRHESSRSDRAQLRARRSL